MKVHAIRAERRELLDDASQARWRAHRLAERIAADIADRPETEREMMFRTRSVRVLRLLAARGHESLANWVAGKMARGVARVQYSSGQRGLRGSAGQRSAS